MHIKTILFDADGVVLKGELFTVRLEKEYGISIETTKDFFTDIFNRCLIGKADLKTEIQPWLMKWKWTGNVESLLDYWFNSSTSVDYQLIEYIQKIRNHGVRCYLATNQEKYRTNYLIRQFKFDHLFDGVFASGNLGVMKPNPNYYQMILNQLEIHDPHSVMFWDDSDKNVVSAANIGIVSYKYIGFDDFKKFMETNYREV